jgi:hypothetical protein
VVPLFYDIYLNKNNLMIRRHILLENKEVTENLEASNRLGYMNWQEAINACKALGNGWRLPTKDELNVVYKNKDKFGDFNFIISLKYTNKYFWSSTEEVYNHISKQSFYSGYQGWDWASGNNNVIAVRSS